MLTQHTAYSSDWRFRAIPNISALMQSAENIAKTVSDSAAILLTELPQTVCENRLDASKADYRNRKLSNGDRIIAIVRQGHVITSMFRRSDQPLTRYALRVDKILDNTGRIIA
jgi:hypothetical protein